MKIEALTAVSASPDTSQIPDIGLPENTGFPKTGDTAHLFSQALKMSADVLQKAQYAELQVVEGHGSILDMSIDRARADALLNVVSAAASRVAGALSTFSNMAV